MNRSPIKTPMPTRDASVRKQDFGAVETGYNEDNAIVEAGRCLHCKHKPCVNGCPVQIDIPAFIEKVVAKDFDGAYDVIAESSSLPAVCGRVCPQESQCEAKCVRGLNGEPVAIGRLERFVADYRLMKKGIALPVEKNGHKAAVIGSGPAGLACAGELARMGYSVVVFEALHLPGGVLVYGIPEFRLPKDIVKKEIDKLKELGVEIQTNTVVGKTLTVDEILEEYEAVFIGSGAGLPKFMNIKGENLNGVFSANEFLTRVNLMKAYLPESDTPIHRGKYVAVVGGGNVAMDAARCALRLGAEKVYVVYRRSEAELPARVEEVAHAKEEGIVFHMLTNPLEILGDENYFVRGIRCIKMELGEPDASGRRSPKEIPNSEFTLDADTVIMSIGTSPNPLIKNTTENLATQKWGGIVADETGLTSRNGVFAGGDAVSGAATVILAMGAGKRAAKAMDAHIRGKHGQ